LRDDVPATVICDAALVTTTATTATRSWLNIPPPVDQSERRSLWSHLSKHKFPTFIQHRRAGFQLSSNIDHWSCSTHCDQHKENDNDNDNDDVDADKPSMLVILTIAVCTARAVGPSTGTQPLCPTFAAGVGTADASQPWPQHCPSVPAMRAWKKLKFGLFMVIDSSKRLPHPPPPSSCCCCIAH
jgi:hypothetical protein